jgi:hypothetical protein
MKGFQVSKAALAGVPVKEFPFTTMDLVGAPVF